MPALQDSINAVRVAAEAADRIKATDIVAFDVADLLGITDIMMIAGASNERQVLAVAEETGMLCTEAIWTRYMPSRKLINEVIESGEIGEVKAASANLCYPVSGKARMDDAGLCRWRAARCGRVSAELPGYGDRCRPWPHAGSFRYVDDGRRNRCGCTEFHHVVLR